MITWDDVTDLDSTLSVLNAHAQGQILTFVESEISETRWGAAQAERARLYLAAHLATVTLRRGAGGQVIGETVGQVSVTYAAALRPGMDSLGSTGYGLEYERLIQQRAAFRFVVA